MSNHRIFAVLLAVLLLGVVAVRAQTSDWEIVAIAGTGDAKALLTIAPDGIREQVDLPAEFPASYEQLVISPDGSRLATIPARWNRVVIADLGGDECCTEYEFSDMPVFLATLGGFSPDGSKLAISFVVDAPVHSAMLILDVATGETLSYVDMTEGSDSDPNFVTYPILLDWQGDTVSFVRSCIMCVDAAMDNTIEHWDQQTGAVSRTSSEYDYRNDQLALADGALRPVFALDYPSAADAEAILWGADEFGIRNAVVLSGEQAENGRDVVYANAEQRNLIARWVADGAAFVVYFTNELPGSGELVLADGRTLPVDHPASQFLAGTPDGWVGHSGGVLTHYRLDDGVLAATELGEYSGAISLVRAPALGADGGSAFATVPPPEHVTCDGFVESRLLAGHLGRVLPGPANNVRAEASTLSPIVAKIAGAEPFAILEGPVCNQGLAWWRVQFNNQEGWTAEGSGTNYWVEVAPENGYRAAPAS